MSGLQYEVRVDGRMSERAQRAFGDYDEVRIVSAPAETVLYVDVTDEAHLQGILTLLATLRLQVVSMQRIPELP
ncbi:hypothetical protein LWP59_18125 [Amycolatopsis acidiphila]|uniref:Uncharacterized protein n=1 Tax=Amycolatopsis acidiphila TaxID=715473 RepID=A0A558ANP5_9PSEU|nr:hypothetical protein [Amycolatopsis acidiphila]TVT25885.1 hypothetical protein FNH06_00110 [Amycolatopsis acidiphila]UIJ63417.1 hypothetical protein LWP59_18125 [Amycolatopsis acidiphila]GHG75478.1 hypothetical protein GCM10017788_40470 [Amycolatopsis acidiphila]